MARPDMFWHGMAWRGVSNGKEWHAAPAQGIDSTSTNKSKNAIKQCASALPHDGEVADADSIGGRRALLDLQTVRDGHSVNEAKSCCHGEQVDHE